MSPKQDYWLSSKIVNIADFPKKGVSFKNILPVLEDPDLFFRLIQDFGQLFETTLQKFPVKAFAGIESRGFIFASALAQKYNKGVLTIRKAGKLPPPTVKKNYQLEYGFASIELQTGHGDIILVDDVLATGGTMQAAIELCSECNYKVRDVGVILNLNFLNQFKFNDSKIKSLITYEK